ncbi:TetR/AcrR family transcriptional regulator [Streptomyces sp. SID13726]|uniref:TetR/AcrR family transcriptional regulator n=1 Tax=Streptomyces sp. SID13726 TaxID=2706058 RepID=UPI0013BA1CD8|nr:TetR/AcrR family transcriptional regulator [Streptomyces sp. SID13726]NEB04146.1 helix-turn-helix transcriptional regulator [Streptomyces sp. SID13726]
MSIRDTPKPIRADAARNRARLLDAARIAFASEAPVSLKQIARDTGVGIGTLYRHFPTREALVEAIYQQELDQLCAEAEALLRIEDPAHALRSWMDRFADYASTRQETADALRAVLASDIVTASPARAQLRAAVQAILDAGTAAGTLRDDVHAEDIVVTLVGMFTTTSSAGGRGQLGRMLDLLMDAVRCPAA